MSVDEDIKSLGRTFAGRLPDDVLKDAINYVDFHERLLALEVLCDQLYEYDVKLIRSEVDRIAQIGRTVGLGQERLALMEKLIE